MSDDRFVVKENHPCWDTSGMYYKEFASESKLIRYYASVVVEQAPESMRENGLLVQQVSEVIKNGIFHGNHEDQSKKIRIWYQFVEFAKLIVEDESEGFVSLEKWKEFYEKREALLSKADKEPADLKYAALPESIEQGSGGNSLFAAINYWNMGIIFNEKRNRVCVMRKF